MVDYPQKTVFGSNPIILRFIQYVWQKSNCFADQLFNSSL